MKLSKIIQKENLKSVTISVLSKETVVCEYFIGSRKKPLKKIYSSLDVDVSINDVSNQNVKHLGIKKYFHLVKKDFYVNLYYY